MLYRSQTRSFYYLQNCIIMSRVNITITFIGNSIHKNIIGMKLVLYGHWDTKSDGRLSAYKRRLPPPNQVTNRIKILLPPRENTHNDS